MPRFPTGLKRKSKLLVYFDEDEKLYLDLKSSMDAEMSMNQYIRFRCFPYGWRTKIAGLKRRRDSLLKKNQSLAT